jgi:hypothetical protein
MKFSITLLAAAVAMASAQEAKYRPVKERLMEIRKDRSQTNVGVRLLLLFPWNANIITSFAYTTAPLLFDLLFHLDRPRSNTSRITIAPAWKRFKK